MSKPLDQLLKELRKNTRLRLGIWLIIAILMGYAFTLVDDYHAKLVQNYNGALSQLRQLQTIALQTQWDDRALQANQLRTHLEAQLWQAETKGLAQAVFQTWLQQKIQQAHIQSPGVRIDAMVEVPHFPDLWQVSAMVIADFVPENLQSLLLEIAKNPRLVVTERLDIHKAGKLKFTLIIRAYFKAGE